MADKNFHGIIIYEIIDNGNLLNGTYTNDGLVDGIVSNGIFAIDSEIAIKKLDSPKNEDFLIGTYDTRYIQTHDHKVHDCILHVTKPDKIYIFTWRRGQSDIFQGFGFKVDSNHLAITYWPI